MLHSQDDVLGHFRKTGVYAGHCHCFIIHLPGGGQLTIIPRTRVGYELLDSGRGAKQRVGYHKLISNKREWNNCFIKYQTLDKNISNYIFYRLEFSAILWKNFL